VAARASAIGRLAPSCRVRVCRVPVPLADWRWPHPIHVLDGCPWIRVRLQAQV